MSHKYFPYSPSNDVQSMENLAVQLFGNRLYTDQTISELLVELLLLVYSPKRFGDGDIFHDPFPLIDSNFFEPGELKYAIKARLNLKLFSFLGASRLDSRHETHRIHHTQLLEKIQNHIYVTDTDDKDDVIRTIENLFLGFQGPGSGRTWCAQSFMPISPVFLAGESIWKESKANNSLLNDWNELFKSNFFSMSQHLFFARGGEILYLQICNALRQTPEILSEWCAGGNLGLSQEEQDPAWLHRELNQALNHFFDFCPSTLSALAEFIDTQLDPSTPKMTDERGEKPRFVNAGWCNTESWREGYLFAVDLLRLMKTNLDVVDRIYLLELACAMQVLRTLAMQSARTCGKTKLDGPGYRWAVSAPDEKRPVIRRLSQHSVKSIEKMIFQSLRSPDIHLPEDEKERKKKLKEADAKYGGKLFIGLAKRIGCIVPKRGSGARFILTEPLLRLLVVTTVPLGGRLTFDSFKTLIEKRFGLVFDAGGLERASQWLNGKGIYLPMDTDKWLQDMLEAAGFLIHLSDSCALVHNPADAGKEQS